MKVIINNGKKNSSGCEINYLVEYDNIFISDNHRFAPWYWINKIDISKPNELIHIDHHYDDNTRELDNALAVLPDITSIEVKEYLDTKLNNFDTCAVSWENIISFFHKYSNSLEQVIINEGALNKDSDIEFHIWDQSTIPKKLCNHNSSRQTILDIDLDFFMNDEIDLLTKDPQYIHDLFSAVKTNISKFDVITIALSPATTKGKWGAIKSIMGIIKSELDENIQIS